MHCSFLNLNNGKNHLQNSFLDNWGYNKQRIEAEMSDADAIITLQELGANHLYDQFCACCPLGEDLLHTCTNIIFNSKYNEYMDMGTNFNVHFYVLWQRP